MLFSRGTLSPVTCESIQIPSMYINHTNNCIDTLVNIDVIASKKCCGFFRLIYLQDRSISGSVYVELSHYRELLIIPFPGHTKIYLTTLFSVDISIFPILLDLHAYNREYSFKYVHFTYVHLYLLTISQKMNCWVKAYIQFIIDKCCLIAF